MNTETLQTSIDNIHAATALGMEVSAPVGTTIYISFAEDSDEENIVYVRGYHATKQSAINELLAFAFDVWLHDEADIAPWAPMNSTAVSTKEEAEELDAARTAWIAGHSDEEILNEYFGENWWSVTELKIEQPHAAPIERN